MSDENLKLEEIEVLKVENIKLKMQKLDMMKSELVKQELEISARISDRLNINIDEYSIDLDKKLLIKK